MTPWQSAPNPPKTKPELGRFYGVMVTSTNFQIYRKIVMKIVYFPDSLNERAPALMGHLFDEHAAKWLTLADVFKLLQAGASVEIHQASPAELQRAENLIELHEVSQLLGEKMRALLDQDADQKMADLAKALSCIYVPMLADVPSARQAEGAPIVDQVDADTQGA
jgi:hypothetical protein